MSIARQQCQYVPVGVPFPSRQSGRGDAGRRNEGWRTHITQMVSHQPYLVLLRDKTIWDTDLRDQHDIHSSHPHV
jgi:hypothetical protein